MLTKNLFMLAAVAAPLAIAACSGPARVGSASVDSTSGSMPSATDSEYSYLSRQMVDSLDERVRLYATAVLSENEGEIQSVGDALAQTALRYKPALVAGLTDEESVRRRAISASVLGFSKDSAMATPLVAIAADPTEEPVVRSRASLGLAVLGKAINENKDRRAVMNALAALTRPSETIASIRQNACTAYARAYRKDLQDNLSVLLEVLTHDPDSSVRRQVLAELRQVREPDAIPEITRIGLNDSDPVIRATAALSLSETPDPRALEALRKASNDQSGIVRKQAVYALAGQRSVAQQPSDVLDIIIEKTGDFDEQVRLSAVRAASIVKHEKAIPTLVSLTRDPSDSVRLASIEALGNIAERHHERDLAPLIDSLNDGDPTIVTAAQRSLAKVSGQNFGRTSSEWKAYYFKRYPETDPDQFFLNKPRPRYVSDGTMNNTARPRTNFPNQQNRNNNNNRNNQRNNTRNTSRTTRSTSRSNNNNFR